MCEFNKITELDDLMVGKYYWCIPKNSSTPSINIVGEMQGIKYVGLGRIWATRHNNQAFATWDMYGPIPLPQSEG